MKISKSGLRLIEQFEGFSASIYHDSVGVATIGYGTTSADVNPLPRHLTQHQAEQLLARKLNEKYGAAINALRLPFNQNQFDALCSFTYNLGSGVLSSGYTVGRLLRGRQWRAAADSMLQYDHAGGQVLAGLSRRRRAERSLFLTPVAKRRILHRKPQSYSGLDAAQRVEARHIIAEGCALLLAHPSAVHYTEGGSRWQGIDHGLRISRGQWMTEGDCSSTATWLLWNALHVRFGLGDIVNGEHWRAGYTGTIAGHGKPVRVDANIQVGDLVLYGPGPSYSHVAVALGGGQVFSHGSEGGPYKLPIAYRSDRGPVHRFI